MAIGRITGPMLYSNLERQGVNLAIDANLVYADVTGRFVGINTATPGYTLDVSGNAHLGKMYFLSNTITTDPGYKLNIGSVSNIQINGGAADYVLSTDGAGNLAWVSSIGLGNTLPLGNTTVGSFSNIVVLTPTTTVTNAIALINQAVGNIAANSNTINGNLTVTGNINVNQNARITGNAIVTGNLSVDTFISGKIQTGSVTIPASANVLYVAKNGSDTNDGTLNSPFLTIRAAMLAVPVSQPNGGGYSVHIAPGIYTENNPITVPQNVAMMGDNLRSVTVIPQNITSDLFYLSGGSYVWGITVKNYNSNAFAYSSTMSSSNFFVSPYIQNITSSSTYPNATAVMVDGNYSSAISTKAMIVGFFTMINQGGYGVRLKNSAYSQLVNIYTIGTEVGIWSETGSFCTLNGSDNSVGNIGLRADGYGPLLTSGNTVSYSINGSFTITGMLSPPHVNQTMVINGDPNFYSIDTITKIDNSTYTVTVPETYVSNLAASTAVSFYQRSAVVASAHTFEYVGAGTVVANALPQYGGIPNSYLNVVTTNGGRVTYTATDEKGNFWIGSNLVINQGTGTISGDAFNRSLFALMTPYILALEAALS